MSRYTVAFVAEGVGFAEGPVAMPDGHLKMVDVRSGWVIDVDPVTGVVERDFLVGGGPNGLASAGDEFIVATTRGMAWMDHEDGVARPRPGVAPENPRTAGIDVIRADGSVEPLYTEFDGHPLLAPNDLVLDGAGGFYFTDIGMAFDRTVDPGGLYYAQTDGSGVRELIHSPVVRTPLNQPNGVALSPDGKVIYVTETQMARAWAWDVLKPGELDTTPSKDSSNGARLVYAADGMAGFDSMAVDGEGFLCIATLQSGGITVVAPDGSLDAFIPMPVWDQFVTNICFGGPDLRTAFVTSSGRGMVWAIDWPRPGLAVAG